MISFINAGSRLMAGAKNSVLRLSATARSHITSTGSLPAPSRARLAQRQAFQMTQLLVDHLRDNDLIEEAGNEAFARQIGLEPVTEGRVSELFLALLGRAGRKLAPRIRVVEQI